MMYFDMFVLADHDELPWSSEKLATVTAGMALSMQRRLEQKGLAEAPRETLWEAFASVAPAGIYVGLLVRVG